MKPRVYKEKMTLENLFPCWVGKNYLGTVGYFKTWNEAISWAIN